MPEWCQATYAAYSQFPVWEGVSRVPTTGKPNLGPKILTCFKKKDLLEELQKRVLYA